MGSDNGLAPTRRQAIIWTNGGLVYWRIYASLGLNELKSQYNNCKYFPWMLIFKMSAILLWA